MRITRAILQELIQEEVTKILQEYTPTRHVKVSNQPTGADVKDPVADFVKGAYTDQPIDLTKASTEYIEDLKQSAMAIGSLLALGMPRFIHKLLYRRARKAGPEALGKYFQKYPTAARQFANLSRHTVSGGRALAQAQQSAKDAAIRLVRQGSAANPAKAVREVIPESINNLNQIIQEELINILEETK